MATIASLHDIDILCLKRFGLGVKGGSVRRLFERFHTGIRLLVAVYVVDIGCGLGVKVGSGRRLFERFQTGEEEDLSGFCSGRSVCGLYCMIQT